MFNLLSITMEKVDSFVLTSLGDSPYVKPHKILYRQNGRDKVWDLVQCHSAVYIVIFNKTRRKVVLVRQFRPAVYFNLLKAKLGHPVKEGDSLDTSLVPGSDGVTIELCAGVVDKSKSLKEIAIDEVWEECGYKVPDANVEEIQQCFGNVGIGGEIMTMFYAEVSDDMRLGSGGGLEEEGEMIEVVEMNVDGVRDLLRRPKVNTSPATLYGLSWFMANKVSM